MDLSKKSIQEKFDLFNDYWSPRIVGESNGQLIKLAKLKGDFVWHRHENEDEYFQIFKGRLFMEFKDHKEELEEGDMIIVPKGIEHNPYTVNGEEAWVILFEPKETLHTGSVEYEKANNNQQWLE